MGVADDAGAGEPDAGADSGGGVDAGSPSGTGDGVDGGGRDGGKGSGVTTIDDARDGGGCAVGKTRVDTSWALVALGMWLLGRRRKQG